MGEYALAFINPAGGDAWTTNELYYLQDPLNALRWLAAQERDDSRNLFRYQQLHPMTGHRTPRGAVWYLVEYVGDAGAPPGPASPLDNFPGNRLHQLIRNGWIKPAGNYFSLTEAGRAAVAVIA